MTKLKPYPKYKDSGIEWIGEVPEGWAVSGYKRLVTICNGQDHKNVEDYDGDYPVIGSGGIFSKSSSYLYCGESVLLGRKGTIDKPLYVNGPFWTIDTMFYTQIKTSISAKYCYYTALNIPFLYYLTNTALPSMTQESLGNHVVPIPPLPEQQTIATYLDRETAQIDALIAKKARSIELLREKRQAMITHAVTKGLNPNAKMKDSGIEWIGDVPEGWEVIPFFSAASESKINNKGMVEDNLLSLSYGNIVRRNINTNEGLLPESFETYQIVEKDNIVFRLTDLQNDQRSLRSAIVKERGIITSAYIAVSIKHAYMPDFFNYLFRAYDALKVFYGMGAGLRQSLKYDDLKRISVLAPPLPEQQTIAAYLDDNCAKIDTLITKTERSIELLKEKRQALITAAVTGKIDVREAAPEAVCC